MAEQHKRLALQPSSAKRWTTCTASPIFIRNNADKIPAEVVKPYADEGSVAHEFCAAGLMMGDASLLGDECPPAMLPHVQGYVQRTLEDAGPCPITIEEKVPLFYMPERNGQIDARWHHPRKLTIRDYKHGAGVKVDAVENLQLLIYARSVYEMLQTLGEDLLPTALVELGIYQPRARNADGSALTTWTIDLPTLIAKTDEIEATARLIQDVALGAQPHELLQFNPVDEPEVCGWCPAKDLCTARLCGIPEEMTAPIGLELMPDASMVGLPTAKTLTVEQMVKIWSYRKEIKSLVEAAESHLFALLSADPRSVPGLKLVASKGGHRKWVDEEEAAVLLAPKLGRGALYEQVMKSPAAIEALLKIELPEPSTRFRNRLAELITKGEGKPTIALESDSRPALSTAQDANPFEAITASDSQ